MTDDRREFIRESRGGAWGSSWSSLKWVTGSRNDRLFGHAVYINDLPQDFRFAVPSVSTLTPSLSVLIVQFQVHDEPAGRLERAARADYLPDGRAHWDGSNSFRMAEDVRSGALDDVRSSLRLQAQEWLRRYFPGAFAELEKPLPAAEYLILDKERPFPPEREPSLLNVLGLWSPWPPFESAELPGVKLTVERPFHREAVLQLASNRNEALASTTLDSGSGRDEFSLLQALDESLHQNIAQYALLRLLDAYHRSLSELRDAAPTSRTSTRASLRQLKRARAESVAQSATSRAPRPRSSTHIAPLSIFDTTLRSGEKLMTPRGKVRVHRGISPRLGCGSSGREPSGWPLSRSDSERLSKLMLHCSTRSRACDYKGDCWSRPLVRLWLH